MRASSTPTNATTASSVIQTARFTSARVQHDRRVHQSRRAGFLDGGGVDHHAVLLREDPEPGDQGVEGRLLHAHRDAAGGAGLGAEGLAEPRLARRAVDDDQQRLAVGGGRGWAGWRSRGRRPASRRGRPSSGRCAAGRATRCDRAVPVPRTRTAAPRATPPTASMRRSRGAAVARESSDSEPSFMIGASQAGGAQLDAALVALRHVAAADEVGLPAAAAQGLAQVIEARGIRAPTSFISSEPSWKLSACMLAPGAASRACTNACSAGSRPPPACCAATSRASM